jgi:ATP-dependent Clp protease adaptor protein ClpS
MAKPESTPSETPVAPRPKPTKKPPTTLPPYHVVLLNDDDHTYDYVIEMLQSLFAHSEQQAYLLAKTVDRTGRAIVCTTHKERAELKRDQILAYGCDFRIASCTSSMRSVIEPAEG